LAQKKPSSGQENNREVQTVRCIMRWMALTRHKKPASGQENNRELHHEVDGLDQHFLREKGKFFPTTTD